MFQRDYEDLVNSYMKNDPNVKKSIDQVASMLNTSEGRYMAQNIANQFGNDMQGALDAVKNGDMSKAQSEIQRLLSTREGAQLADQIKSILGNKF